MADVVAATRWLVRRWAPAVALAIAGCTFTHRIAVPTPVVETEPHERFDAAVGVHYAPGASSAEQRESFGPFNEQTHVWVGSVAEPLEQTFDAVVPMLFTRVERSSDPGPPPAGSSLDVILEVRAEKYAFDRDWPATGTCRAQVACRFVLRARERGEVAQWQLKAEGRQGIGWVGSLASCVGEATALALQEVGARFARELPEVPGVREWLARLPRVPEPKAIASSPAAPTHASSAGGESPAGWSDAAAAAAPAAPRPVEKREPFRPRTLGIIAGAGVVSPRGSRGHLESPAGGLAVAFGAPIRPWRYIGFDLDFQMGMSSFGVGNLTAPRSGFISPSAGDRLDFTQKAFLPGIRVAWPLPFLEPSVSAGPAFLFQNLSWPATLLGFPGTIDDRDSFAVGLHAAVGLDLLIPPSISLGVRYRWLFASGDFGPLSNGSADTGGSAFLVQLGWHFPRDQAAVPER